MCVCVCIVMSSIAVPRDESHESHRPACRSQYHVQNT